MKEEETAADTASGKNARYLKLQVRALVALAACAVTVLLSVGHEVFVPVALALLFALVLSSAVEALHRRGLPRSVSAILMLVMFCCTITFCCTSVRGGHGARPRCRASQTLICTENHSGSRRCSQPACGWPKPAPISS